MPPGRKNVADIDLSKISESLQYMAIPKVELHRHLEGSLRLKTIVEVASATGMTVPLHAGPLGNLVQIQTGEANTFQNFLAKFATQRLFYRSPEIIHRITREAIEDAALDNIRYLELRFTPIALSRAEHFPLEEVSDWVCETFGMRLAVLKERILAAARGSFLPAEQRMVFIKKSTQELYY